MRVLPGIVLLAAALLAGSCAVDLPPPSSPLGTLLITEIAAEPEENHPEWIELLNASDADVILSNCVLRTVDGDNDLFLELTVAPGERIILADQADLTAEVGILRADAVLQDLLLRHSSADETIELFCAESGSQSALVASATYNWSDEDLRKGHTRQRVEGAETETWCEAPTQDDAIYFDELVPANPEDPESEEMLRLVEYGSPYAPALCDVAAGMNPSQRGQVLFTEVVPDAVDDAIPEWFELQASPANADTIDLRGCQLLEAPHMGGDGTIRSHVFDPELGTTGIAPGERLLLAKDTSNPASDNGFLVIDDSVEVDYFYSSLTFSNSALRVLSLSCPGDSGPVEIDSVSFEWASFDGDFDGYSLELSDGAVPTDRLDASANDRPAAWCTADESDVYAEGEYIVVVDDTDIAVPYIHRGTPGAPNGTCPVPDPWPGEGDVIFTEIMGNPGGSDTSEEWFELWNTTGQRVELNGCRVDNNNFDTGSNGTWHINESVVLQDDGRAVLASSESGDFWACYDEPDARFTDFGLNNSNHEDLILTCPDGIGGDIVVDRIEYDSNFPDFVSLQVPLALASAAQNDDTAQWCSVPAGDPAYTFSCVDETTGETSYGTPGEGPNCQ